MHKGRSERGRVSKEAAAARKGVGDHAREYHSCHVVEFFDCFLPFCLDLLDLLGDFGLSHRHCACPSKPLNRIKPYTVCLQSAQRLARRPTQSTHSRVWRSSILISSV